SQSRSMRIRFTVMHALPEGTQALEVAPTEADVPMWSVTWTRSPGSANGCTQTPVLSLLQTGGLAVARAAVQHMADGRALQSASVTQDVVGEGVGSERSMATTELHVAA